MQAALAVLPSRYHAGGQGRAFFLTAYVGCSRPLLCLLRLLLLQASCLTCTAPALPGNISAELLIAVNSITIRGLVYWRTGRVPDSPDTAPRAQVL